MYKFIFIGMLLLLVVIAFSVPNALPTFPHQPNFASQLIDSSKTNTYSWIANYSFKDNIVNQIPITAGYERIKVAKGSFADWLRHLPLKTKGASVHLYNGNLKSRQDVQEAVVNIDAGGTEDLQQCADACMRLKAEYHYSRKEFSKIHFKFTNGDVAFWTQWMNGYRPLIKGNKVAWMKNHKVDESYNNFKSYLKIVFRYAGTQSKSGIVFHYQRSNTTWRYFY